MTTRRALFTAAAAAASLTALPAGSHARPRAPNGAPTLRQIRNATLHVRFAGVSFLVDPMLSGRHSWPGIPGTVNSEQRNPLVHLPLPVDEILDVDAVIVTHLHEDHWDEAARRLVPKAATIFAQNPADAGTLRSQGFTQVSVLSDATEFRGVRLIRTPGRHGGGVAYAQIGPLLGEVSGVMFKREGHKTLYIAGDTVWNADVAATLASHAPEIVVLNTGDARVTGLPEAILMGAADVLAVHRAAPQALLIGSHMEAINHCTLTRADLRAFARSQGFDHRLLTPGDGELVAL